MDPFLSGCTSALPAIPVDIMSMTPSELGWHIEKMKMTTGRSSCTYLPGFSCRSFSSSSTKNFSISAKLLLLSTIISLFRFKRVFLKSFMNLNQLSSRRIVMKIHIFFFANLYAATGRARRLSDSHPDEHFQNPELSGLVKGLGVSALANNFILPTANTPRAAYQQVSDKIKRKVKDPLCE